MIYLKSAHSLPNRNESSLMHKQDVASVNYSLGHRILYLALHVYVTSTACARAPICGGRASRRA